MLNECLAFVIPEPYGFDYFDYTNIANELC